MLAACTTPTEVTPSPLLSTNTPQPSSAPTHTPKPSLTPTPLKEANSPTPSPSESATLRLRIEYDTTTVFGELEIAGMEDALSFDIVEVVDGIGLADPGLISLELGGADEASMVVDVVLPQDDDRILTFTSINDPPGGSFVSIYLLPDEGNAQLLHQLDHRWWKSNGRYSNSSTFTMDLGQLASQPLSLITPVVNRADITCGQNILADATLTADLSCSRGFEKAIIIGASNITLDLGGNVLSGVPVGTENPSTGVFASNVDGVTIRNGTFQDFDEAIFVIGTDHVLIENLTIRNLGVEDPMHNIVGLHIAWCDDVIVRDSRFEFNPILHRTAVGFNDSRDVHVSNIEVHGGSVGVDHSFAQVCDPETNNSIVQNSSFYNLSNEFGIGIFVQCSSSAQIEGIVVDKTFVGISGDAPFLGAVTNLVIDGNTVQGGFMDGIALYGVKDSSITNNIVSGFIHGIYVGESYGCLVEDPYWECHYSTANVISDNVSLSNSTDIQHHELSIGNSWGENTCESTAGIEIPECTQPNQ